MNERFGVEPNEEAGAERERERERMERLKPIVLTAMLTHAAEQRPDELLGPREWERLGLGAWYQLEYGEAKPPGEFQWIVAVRPDENDENATCLSLTIFETDDVWSVYSASIPKRNFPLADPKRQDAVFEEIAVQRKERSARQRIKHEERIALAERTRGFPAGVYSLRATYPAYRGGTKTRVWHRFEVRPEDLREEVEKHVRSSTVMEGLHNFGMRTDHHGVPVTVDLMRGDEAVASFEMTVDPDGHML
jgi:hypothetical protein